MKDTLPSFRSQFVVKRTYNRPLDDEGTVFETREQTIDRVIGHQRWLWEKAKGKMVGEDMQPLTEKEEAELEELRGILLRREAAVSGRTMWLGGTDISKLYHATQFNPFVAGTKVLTKEFGVTEIENLEGLSFNVVGKDGNFYPAFGSYSGKQKTFEIYMSRKNSATSFTASENHRWWLEDGRRVTTSELNIGDKIPVVIPQGVKGSDEGFLHGFIYGDGSINNKATGGTYTVRLCGNKNKHQERLKQFSTGESYPPSANGDLFMYFGSIGRFSENLKELPKTENVEYIAGFIDGLLAADGSSDGKQISGTKETIDYVEKYAHLAGILVTSRRVYKNDVTNFGKRSQPLHAAVFSKWEEPMRVRAIEERETEDVWCCTVPGHEAFVLGGGVLTSNCSFLQIKTVHDVVDGFHSLLLGVGVGFEPITGILNGFAKPVDVEVIRSTRKDRGNDNNQELHYTRDGKRVWRLVVGDSGIAWAKAAGKILAMKKPVDVVILDFSEVRPGGKPLRGFGWISSGDEQISEAFEAIAKIMNKKAGQLLTRMDILDVMNWLGTSLSSRRSAEIALFPADDPEAEEFANAKKDYWKTGNKQRAQSNNSLVFYHKPTKRELRGLFSQMLEAGGSEPGFINGATARKKAPWFRGVNPCSEILLGDKNHCNLITTNLAAFNGREKDLHRVHYLMARANYRQTCVNLKDGILQETWHELNQFLRLTGAGCAGIVMWEHHKNPEKISALRKVAHDGVNSMADELNLPRSKACTTVKPDGTVGKMMDTTEGIHKPLSKYIFNNIIISKASPLLKVAIDAGYRHFEHPFDSTSEIVTLPVCFEGVEFDVVEKNGAVLEVNLESAVEQLERYKLWMDNYADHNVSITVSYSPDESEEIIEWLHKNWDHFVGVSFLLRADPTKTAEDLGYAYLPQQPVTKEEYYAYVATLKPVDLDSVFVSSLDALEDDCSSGVCPIR